MDSWSEPENLIIFKCTYFLRMLPLFPFESFLNFIFCTIILTSCLVYLFYFSKCLLFFYFACLISAFSVVHLSVVYQHVPWYLQIFLPAVSSTALSSSESLRLLDFLFLALFFFIFFLKEHLGKLIFPKYSKIVLYNSGDIYKCTQL